MNHAVLILFAVINSMRANDVLSPCDPNDNDGVFDEFGPLPTTLRDAFLYREIHGTGYHSTTVALTGRLEGFKVEYHEFTSVYGTGSEFYGFLTLYYWDPVSLTFKTLDYLRVDINRWRRVQQAVQDGDYKADDNRLIRIKFLTHDCNCVQRVYDLKSSDIPADATTQTCDGNPITTTLHRTPTRSITISTVPDVTKFGLKNKYPGCDVNNNIGVLDMFGPLPANLFDIHYYYEAINLEFFKNKYKLWRPMENYAVTYSEYKSQGDAVKMYNVLTLYYYEFGKFKVIDYLRVHPHKWHDVQVAMLEADPKPDVFRKLKVRYLTADCACAMRVYDLSAVDVVAQSVTKSCDGLTVITQPTTNVVLQEQAELRNANKVTFMQWYQQMSVKRE